VRRRAGARAIGAAAGIVTDRLVGEPHLEPHPVAAYGSLMTAVERRLWRDDRTAGVVHAAIGTAIGLAAGRVAGSTTAATWLAVGGRMLGEIAGDVGQALAEGDLERARRLLPALVGRDPTLLDEHEIARAVVESVAENTVDAVVAPALWAAALGAPGALGYRAVNTLDAMVGHRSDRYERYGWASARLDDVANWMPARVTAGLVAVVRPAAAPTIWRTVRRDAGAHSSPNAGVAEAAFAAALDVRLGGENRYGERVEHRAPLGRGRPPEARDITAAVSLLRDVSWALAAALFTVGAASVLRRRG